jgi:DNA-binding GntR family transcriptional regulator
MRQPPSPTNANEPLDIEKVPFLLVKWIREAILDEAFKAGDRLAEGELAEKFEVSRSPVREALLALEKEGTVVMSPYRGAIVRPLSAEEILDIAELRLALIFLALEPAYDYLSPADFDHAYDLAKRISRTGNAKDLFQYNRQFWDTILSKAQRPILWEVVRRLDDRMTRYDPFFLKIFPTPETRPRQRETLIEIYRKGEIAGAFQAFKKTYLQVVDQFIDRLDNDELDASRS